tara:strand:- start:10434 stop:10637 length:204 start_codon:yes stop_codon:yes gene_type:complete
MTTEFNTPFVEADLRKAANDLDNKNNEMLDLINDEYLQDEDAWSELHDAVLELQTQITNIQEQMKWI